MSDVHAFLDAFETFFRQLAAVEWSMLWLALLAHLIRLALRVRAWQSILVAAFPCDVVALRSVLGAYIAGVGVNSLLPARGGDVVKLYLARQRIPGSSYPALGSTLLAETLFDLAVGLALLLVALQLGVLPGLPDLPRLPAFDWSFVASHPQLAATLGGVVLAALLLLWAWASRHVTALRAKLRQGLAILGDPRGFFREVVTWQIASWIMRTASVALFLAAFHIDASPRTILAVLVVQSLSTLLPFTPGGIGAQQAVLVFALTGEAARSAVLSFSVGMQLATTLVNVLFGFAALALMAGSVRLRTQLLAARADVDSRRGEDESQERD